MTRRSPKEYNWKRLEFDETILRKHFTRQAKKDVRYIGIHHAVIRDRDPGKPDGLNKLWDIWQTRKASAQYGVEKEFVRQFVWDKDYAWASGSYLGNKHGIHIEHIEKTLDEPGTKNDYIVDEKTWKTGARLVGYLHYKHNMGRPRKGITVRQHWTWKATGCPGPFLGKEIWDEYVAESQRVYDAIVGGTKKPPAPAKKKRFTRRGEAVDHALKDLQKAKGSGHRKQMIDQALDSLKKIKPFY